MKSLDEVSDDFEMHLSENAGPYNDPDLIGEMASSRESWSPAARTLAVPDPDLIGGFADQVAPPIHLLQGLGVKFDFLPPQFLSTDGRWFGHTSVSQCKTRGAPSP